MSNEQFKHIQKIRQTYRDDSELSKANQISLIKIIAEDLNNTDAHFIFELIQNAEDNKYVEPVPYISFRLTKTDPTYTDGSEGALIVENNEVGFNHNDVDTICAAAQSPKKKKHEYIGEKGIGFKSVFRVTENPHIFSNGYHFCLPKFDEETGLGYIVPQWIDIPPKGLDISKTHIILPLNRMDFGYDKIEDMLQDIEPETILFLSKLQEIRIKTDTGTDLTILKNDSAKPKFEILIEGKKQDQSFSVVNDFLVGTQTFHKPAHIDQEKREDIEKRDVSIAFQLDEDSMRIGKIFAYLPVKPIDFPFLVNADFILTSSRQDIHRDSPWNHWLIDCMADVIATKLLPLLKEREFLSVDFLEALASKLNSLAEDKSDLFYPVFSRLRETFMNEELLPANDDTFVSAQNAVLTRSTAVRNLLTHTQLDFLFQRSDVEFDSELKWLSADITQDRTPNLRQYLIRFLDFEDITPARFSAKLSLDFLSAQEDKWFVEFYVFLFGRSALWNSEGSVLRTKPILRLENDKHVNPPKNQLTSNVYLSLDPETDVSLPIVKSSISQDKGALKFLRELGIPEWDIVAEVIKQILPKYWNNLSSISSAEYEHDFKKIVSAYAIASEKKKDQLREKLLTTSFILSENSHVNDQIYLKPNQLYFGTDEELWSNNSIGSYSRVFVSEEVCKFLRTLEISKWDVVDEVIQTILPKYKQNPPRVPIEEHISDLEKITCAYTNSLSYSKMQLQTELKATRFILIDGTHEHNPEYHRPNELYFGTEELRLYFEGNDSYKFVSSEYYDRHIEVFRELGISYKIRITCKSKPGTTDDIDLEYQSKCYRRGLKGFDPNIQVAGLKHALISPSAKKSKVIWEHVAVPYSHCITGKILRSSRQNFSVHARIYEENEVTSDFGRMLMENAWLPDSDGNMHKPSEITLAELPEGFVRDERLANQLGMKKDEVAELADKIGISEEEIRDFVENKEEYMEWKTEKAKREQVPLSESEESESETISYQIDYPVEIEKSFNKSGKTEVQPHIVDSGRVNNPERRREKIAEEHRDRLNREPSTDDRRRETYRTILEGPDPRVREYLFQMYGGECQICGGTFPERDGTPFFVASYIVERRKSGAVDTPANALCLCADHFAKFKHGKSEAGNITTQIENFQTESEGGDREPILYIKLCGEECEIRFKEKHLLDLQELLKTASDNYSDH